MACKGQIISGLSVIPKWYEGEDHCFTHRLQSTRGIVLPPGALDPDRRAGPRIPVPSPPDHRAKITIVPNDRADHRINKRGNP